MLFRKFLVAMSLALLLFGALASDVDACTGVRLIAKDGTTVYGRSMEWGTFDINTRVSIIPRGYQFRGLTPDGQNGKQWTAKYGVLGLDALNKDELVDGMNETGLTAGLFYHPGFAKYQEYDKSQAANTIDAADVLAYILSQYATIAEVKKGLANVRIGGVVEPALGMPVPAHWIVVEPSGKSIVIEHVKGKLQIFDNPLGVITNSPAFDWHLTNLRNYVNLSPVAIPGKRIEDINFKPLGGGSGMIGLPGDFTPPSRFIRVVAWSQTARPLPDSNEAVYELFRILDNFNVPLGAAEGSDHAKADLQGMRSATLWTSGWDTAQKVLYFHTQHNRRLRKVDLKKLDFSGSEIKHLPLDKKKEQDVEDITPAK